MKKFYVFTVVLVLVYLSAFSSVYAQDDAFTLFKKMDNALKKVNTFKLYQITNVDYTLGGNPLTVSNTCDTDFSKESRNAHSITESTVPFYGDMKSEFYNGIYDSYYKSDDESTWSYRKGSHYGSSCDYPKYIHTYYHYFSPDTKFEIGESEVDGISVYEIIGSFSSEAQKAKSIIQDNGFDMAYFNYGFPYDDFALENYLSQVTLSFTVSYYLDKNTYLPVKIIVDTSNMLNSIVPLNNKDISLISGSLVYNYSKFNEIDEKSIVVPSEIVNSAIDTSADSSPM